MRIFCGRHGRAPKNRPKNLHPPMCCRDGSAPIQDKWNVISRLICVGQCVIEAISQRNGVPSCLIAESCCNFLYLGIRRQKSRAKGIHNVGHQMAHATHWHLRALEERNSCKIDGSPPPCTFCNVGMFLVSSWFCLVSADLVLHWLLCRMG